MLQLVGNDAGRCDANLYDVCHYNADGWDSDGWDAVRRNAGRCDADTYTFTIVFRMLLTNKRLLFILFVMDGIIIN